MIKRKTLKGETKEDIIRCKVFFYTNGMEEIIL